MRKNVKKSDDFAAALSDAEKVMDQTHGECGRKPEKASKQAGNGMEDGGRGAKNFDMALGTLIGNG